MAWLEIIDIRSASTKSQHLQKELPQLLDALQLEFKGDTIKVYRHLSLETDFSIHIYHAGIPATHHTHPASLRLISVLKGFGLVNHSFWVEQFES